MAHIALDGLDQVGDEVVPALELHVDAAPALGHQIFVGHQPVVNGHRPDKQEHHHAQENVKCHVLASDRSLFRVTFLSVGMKTFPRNRLGNKLTLIFL